MASLDLRDLLQCLPFSPTPGMMHHVSLRAAAIRDFLTVSGRIFATVQVWLNVMAVLVW